MREPNHSTRFSREIVSVFAFAAVTAAAAITFAAHARVGWAWSLVLSVITGIVAASPIFYKTFARGEHSERRSFLPRGGAPTAGFATVDLVHAHPGTTSHPEVREATRHGELGPRVVTHHAESRQDSRDAAAPGLNRVSVDTGGSNAPGFHDGTRRVALAVPRGRVALPVSGPSEIRTAKGFRAIFEHCPECIKVLDAECRLLDMNRAGLDMVEADSLDELRGRFVLDLVIPEHRGRFLADLGRALKSDGPVTTCFEIKGLRGTRRWMEQHAVAFPSEDGALNQNRVLCVTRDITEQRVSAERAARSEREFRQLFEKSPDALLIYRSPEGRILEANQRASDIYGIPHDQLVGMSIDRLSENHDHDRAMIERMLRTGVSADFESSHLRGNGTRMPVEINASVIEYQDGRAVLSVHRDSTWRKQAELKLVRSSQLEAMATVTSGIAHEFNSMLLAAGSYLHGVKADDPASGRAIENARSQVHHAQGLSASMMELYSGGPGATSETLDLGAWLPEKVREIGGLLGAGVRVAVEPAPARTVVRSDAVSLEQVLRVLFFNAKDAMKGEGEIRIELSRCPWRSGSLSKVVEVRVIDNGPGVPDADRSRIFDLYFTTKSDARRRGLGLSIAKQIVENLGGTLRHEPAPDRGSVFVIGLLSAE